MDGVATTKNTLKNKSIVVWLFLVFFPWIQAIPKIGHIKTTVCENIIQFMIITIGTVKLTI